jgi:hypothetical protein
MRIALIVLLAVHGAIHMLGFLQVWKIFDFPQLRNLALYAPTQGAAKSIGAQWLMTGLLLLLSAVLVGVHAEYAWLYLGISIVLSQLLIVYAWSDARAGTLVNLLLVLPVLVGAARAQFGFETDRMVQRMFTGAPAESAVVQESQLAPLPAAVQRWLSASGVVGRPVPRSVRLKQTAEMRTAPDGEWMPTRAEQYFSTRSPGFVWQADVHMKNGLSFAGRDSYLGGHGRMLIRALALWPIVDASDDKIQQGALLRFLGEMVWFPSAALQPYITWRSLDAHRAEASLHDGNLTVSGTFSVDDAGRVTHFVAQRYFGGGPNAKLETWEVPMHGWKHLAGIQVPTEGVVRWQPDFDYYRFKIDAIEYDQPRSYSDVERPLPAPVRRGPLVSQN